MQHAPLCHCMHMEGIKKNFSNSFFFLQLRDVYFISFTHVCGYAYLHCLYDVMTKNCVFLVNKKSELNYVKL